jgi:hypothetical protein
MAARCQFQKLITEAKVRNHDNGAKTAKMANDYDKELADLGCRVFERHIFSMFVCMLSGLLCLMYVPTIVQVLERTKQSKDAPSAFKRYLHTLNHMMRWYDSRHEERLASLKLVRRTHNHVARNGIITQYDMVLTQWGFIGPALLFPTKLGMGSVTKRELNALRYIIYLVGQSLGIDEDLNLCVNSLAETSKYAQIILKEVINPSLTSESDSSRVMSDNLLGGMTFLNPFILPVPYKTWTFKMLGSSRHNYYSTSMTGVQNKVIYHLQCEFFDRAMNWGVRPVANLLLRINVSLANLLEHHIVIDNHRRIM